LDILIVYLDGIRLGSHHILGSGAPGSIPPGKSTCAEALPTAGPAARLQREHDGRHGTAQRPGAARIDAGSPETVRDRSRRAGIAGGHRSRRAGTDNPVQRCRAHKLRNPGAPGDHLPKDQHANAKSTLRAAYKLPADKGKRQIEQLAKWYEKKHPSAADPDESGEGLDELFTINAMGLPPKLLRCLATTNIIESTNGGVRQRINRVKNWQDGLMALRWAPAAFEATAANPGAPGIMGHQQLWILQAHLEPSQKEDKVGVAKKVG
jgi:hypothetical protein